MEELGGRTPLRRFAGEAAVQAGHSSFRTILLSSASFAFSPTSRISTSFAAVLFAVMLLEAPHLAIAFEGLVFSLRGKDSRSPRFYSSNKENTTEFRLSFAQVASDQLM